MKSIALVAFALGAVPVLAQTPVQDRRPASKDGRVEIENAAGSITVIGWDRAEVAVEGTMGRGAESLSLTGTGRTTRIEVETSWNPHMVRSDLEIHVPSGSRIEIESFAAQVKVDGVRGAVRANTVKGDVSVRGAAKEVEAETVSGSVEIAGGPTRIRAHAVNGTVTLQGARGDVEASTVNGDLVLAGARCEACRLETVNGDVRFNGDLASGSRLDVETVGGSVELVLPADVSAEFDVETFSGDVENELGPTPKKASRHLPGHELRFTAGGGGAQVSVNTMNGSVRIRKR